MVKLQQVETCWPVAVDVQAVPISPSPPIDEVHGQNGNKSKWRQVKTVTPKWLQKGKSKWWHMKISFFLSLEYGQTSTSWNLLSSSCGRAGSADIPLPPIDEVHGQNGNKSKWRQVKKVTPKWLQKGKSKWWHMKTTKVKTTTNPIISMSESVCTLVMWANRC